MPRRTHSSNLHVILRWSDKNHFYIPDRVIIGYPNSSTIREWVSAGWCPLQRSRLMPSRTHSSNLHVIHRCSYENNFYIPDRVVIGYP